MDWLHIILGALGGAAATAASVRYMPWVRAKLMPPLELRPVVRPLDGGGPSPTPAPTPTPSPTPPPQGGPR